MKKAERVPGEMSAEELIDSFQERAADMESGERTMERIGRKAYPGLRAELLRRLKEAEGLCPACAAAKQQGLPTRQMLTERAEAAEAEAERLRDKIAAAQRGEATAHEAQYQAEAKLNEWKEALDESIAREKATEAKLAEAERILLRIGTVAKSACTSSKVMRDANAQDDFRLISNEVEAYVAAPAPGQDGWVSVEAWELVKCNCPAGDNAHISRHGVTCDRAKAFEVSAPSPAEPKGGK